MILERKSKQTTAFGEILVGDSFMEVGTNSGVYIKTQIFEKYGAILNAVRLADAHFEYFQDPTEVEICNAKVVY